MLISSKWVSFSLARSVALGMKWRECARHIDKVADSSVPERIPEREGEDLCHYMNPPIRYRSVNIIHARPPGAFCFCRIYPIACRGKVAMKILMGIDNWKFSGDMVRAVVMQFRTENTEIIVLHVLQLAGPAPPQMDPDYAPELAGEEKPAHALVERIAKALRTAGFKADTAVEVGDVRERIIDSAAKWNADLIVIGSHGQTGIRRFLLGAVAESVARHAKCSVEIIRAPESI